MNEFKVIVIMNEATLEILKKKNFDYSLNQKIKKYLKDESCFFKINKQTAYKILKVVGVKQEQIENVYKKLIAPDMYYDLLNKGKISTEDNNIIIKYDNYRL